MSGRITSTYATALLELAAETESAAGVGAELQAVADAIFADPSVAAFLASRQIGGGVKKRLLGSVLSGQVDYRLFAFLMLLSARGRLGSLAAMAREYGRLEESSRGVGRVTVTSASELDEAARERIVRALGERLGQAVVLQTKVDPTLVAGLRVEIEGMEYELSVNSLLKGLAARLAVRPGSGA